jgi:hypothetical protein
MAPVRSTHCTRSSVYGNTAHAVMSLECQVRVAPLEGIVQATAY